MRTLATFLILACLGMVLPNAPAEACVVNPMSFGTAYGGFNPMTDIGTAVKGDNGWFYCIYDGGVNEFRVKHTDMIPLTHATLSIEAEPQYIAYEDDHVFILHKFVGGDCRLTVIDVSAPQTPTIVHSGNLTGLANPNLAHRGMELHGGYLWISHGGMLSVYDVAVPSSPSFIEWTGGWYTTFESDLLAATNGWIYTTVTLDHSSGSYPLLLVYNGVDVETRPVVYEYELRLTDFEGYDVQYMYAGPDHELFVSLVKVDGSALLRFAAEAGSNLTLLSSLESTDSDFYRSQAMEAQGSYLYQQRYPGWDVNAVDISAAADMSFVSSGDFITGPMCLLTKFAWGANRYILLICDRPTVLSSGQFALNEPTPGGGESQTWAFHWYTEEWSDPYQDRVRVQAASGIDCGFEYETEFSPGDPLVEATVEFDPTQGTFLHRLTYEVGDCHLGCVYDWEGASAFFPGVEDNVTGKLKVDLCIGEIPPGGGLPGKMASTTGIVLDPPSPNPFNPQTTLRFHLPAGCARADLDVYDVGGRRVKRLAVDNAATGWQSVVWDGRQEDGSRVPSGIYFAMLSTDRGNGELQKLVLVK